MSKVFVYSTLTADNMYGPYNPGAADLPVRTAIVLIKGGANVAGMKHLITPRGVCTVITEEELAICRQDPTFVLHEKNGFLAIESKQADADHVAANMTGRDESAPLVPDDITPDEPIVATNKPLAPVPPVSHNKPRRR
jgi:hypothetical protein